MFRQQNLYLLLFSLYWAQGLPVGFMTHALPVILRAEGVSLAHIGGFGLLMLPWSIKIFWAPWVDRHAISHLGHYRSWILPAQFLTVGVLCILSFFPIQVLDQPLYLFIFFITLLFMNLTGATQDIATDALAVNLLQHDQQHWGN
ncbi:MFS transporter, partial [Acinetobacter baumannii]|nr:MFS transporter [Acinetobacter baumannii]